MKKTRFMLLAILVMAVVAGTFAFKTVIGKRICLYQGPTNGAVCTTTISFLDDATTCTSFPDLLFETTKTTAYEADCPAIDGIICDQQLTLCEE